MTAFPASPAQAVAVMTKGHAARKVFAANVANTNAFSTLTDLSTKPVSSGAAAVIEMRAGSLVELFPFGTDANNEQFRIRIARVIRVQEVDPATQRTTNEQWVPQIIGIVEAQLSQRVGLAGRLVLDTDRYADTLTEIVDKGMGPNGVRLVQGSSDDDPAHIVIDPVGADLLLVEVTSNGVVTAAASFNLLERVVSS